MNSQRLHNQFLNQVERDYNLNDIDEQLRNINEMHKNMGLK